MSDSKGISKRQFLLRYGANPKLADELLERGVIKYLPNPSSPLRKKIDVDSLTNLKEGIHFVTCRQCGSYQRKITTKHLKSCGPPIKDVPSYSSTYPDALILSEWSSKKHEKTEEEKIAQSETLKKRFQTPEGEITRLQISEASKALMQTEYREQAAKHLKELNQEPEQKEFLRELTTERWEEGGDLRKIVPKWHEDNKELSNQLAFNARKHIKKKRSKLHLGFKQEMVKEGLDEFKTEYEVGHYHIDEARPDLKLSVEVDGCYWHSCPICELEGPKETLSYDNRKESYLSNRGWTILRFWGHEIKADSEKCIMQIKEKITQLKLEADRHE